MSKGRHISAEALCPFYVAESSNRIYCEGIPGGSGLSVSFNKKKDFDLFRLNKCCGSYRSCHLENMLWSSYDGGDAPSRTESVAAEHPCMVFTDRRADEHTKSTTRRAVMGTNIIRQSSPNIITQSY